MGFCDFKLIYEMAKTNVMLKEYEERKLEQKIEKIVEKIIEKKLRKLKE